MTGEELRAHIEAQARTDTRELRADFENLRHVKVDLPPGEEAYWTIPRQKGEWRLSAHTLDASDSDEPVLLPMRERYFAPQAYMNVLPDIFVLHRRVARALECEAEKQLRHYPVENSLARREYDTPTLLGRWDVLVQKDGYSQLCEAEEVPSLWAGLPEINPIADSYIDALEQQIGMPIFTAELFEYTDGSGDSSSWWNQQAPPDIMWVVKELAHYYFHNDMHRWGDINNPCTSIDWTNGHQYTPDEVALTVRARRGAPGFAEHMDKFGPRSITMAWERDNKFPLVAERLGALATNLDVALQFVKEYQHDHQDELLVLKALHSARTERTAVVSAKGTRPRGVASLSQVRRKFARAVDASSDPIVIQPYTASETVKDAGLSFGERDRSVIQSVIHCGGDAGTHVVPGQEDKHNVLLRPTFLWLPKERRIKLIGGSAFGTYNSKLVHGTAHSVVYPLYIDGLLAHPDIQDTNGPLERAEALVRQYSSRPIAS